jgi:hypothetical protein
VSIVISQVTDLEFWQFQEVLKTIYQAQQLVPTLNKMYNPARLFKAPEVNPVNHKARSIPGLNVFNIYGRVFFFSWFGFMIAFWSWYAFPPLVRTREKPQSSKH